MVVEVTEGGVFIFVNRCCTALKLLKYDHDGLAVYHKRLVQVVFEDPWRAGDGSHLLVTAEQLTLILQGIRLFFVVRNKRFRLRA